MNEVLQKLKALNGEAEKWSIFHQNPADGDAVLERLIDRWFPGRTDLRILEIGTCRCVSASLFARRGRVVTLDVCAYPEADAVLDALGARGRVARLVGPPEMTRHLVRGRHFDFAFIDGKHSYGAVMEDWAMVTELTQRVIFHDYHTNTPEVIRAVDELKARTPGDWHHDGCFAAWSGV